MRSIEQHPALWERLDPLVARAERAVRDGSSAADSSLPAGVVLSIFNLVRTLSRSAKVEGYNPEEEAQSLIEIEQATAAYPEPAPQAPEYRHAVDSVPRPVPPTLAA